MARTQRKGSLTAGTRGRLARPLDALAFLLPMIVFYEVAYAARPGRVIAFDLLRGFIELFGPAGIWAPGLLIVVILLATHVASSEPWRIDWRRVGGMYVESVALAAPLLLLNWALPLIAGTQPPALIDRIAMGIGAGIYEELVFRLILISGMVMVGADLFRWDRSTVAVAAIIVSSLIFSAHHHQPIGMEPFHAGRFAFRAMAGAYLALIFWYRGYGPAAGCHAGYNVTLALIADA